MGDEKEMDAVLPPALASPNTPSDDRGLGMPPLAPLPAGATAGRDPSPPAEAPPDVPPSLLPHPDGGGGGGDAVANGGGQPRPLDAAALLADHPPPPAGPGSTPSHGHAHGGDTPPLLAGDSAGSTPMHGAAPSAALVGALAAAHPPADPAAAVQPSPPLAPPPVPQQQQAAADKVLQIRMQRQQLAQQLLALQQQEQSLIQETGMGTNDVIAAMGTGAEPAAGPATALVAMGGGDGSPAPPSRDMNDPAFSLALTGALAGVDGEPGVGAGGELLPPAPPTPPPSGVVGSTQPPKEPMAVPSVVQPGQFLSPEVAMQMAAMGNWGVSPVPAPAFGASGAQSPPEGPSAALTAPGLGAGSLGPSLGVAPGSGIGVSSAAAGAGSVESARGSIAQVARDQQGARWLCRQCEQGSDAEVAAIFDEVAEQMDLGVDACGSQVLAALFKRCGEPQRALICERLACDLQVFAFNMHGTRLVQRVVDLIRSREQLDTMTMAVVCQAHALIKDLNGNHIVQQCLQSFPPDVCQGIHDAVVPRVVEFGTHRHGCCVLQRCIEFGNDAQKMALVAEVINNGLCLVQDPFGNYLLQYILEMDVDFVNVRVMRQFLGSVAQLSTNKFASNVIEKCLKLAADDVRQLLIDEIVDAQRLPALLQDQYANYVVQTALSCASPGQWSVLQQEITPLLHLIRNTPHGKRIESRLRQGARAGGGSEYNRRQRQGTGDSSWSRMAPWNKTTAASIGHDAAQSAQNGPVGFGSPPPPHHSGGGGGGGGGGGWGDAPPQRVVTVLASGGTLISEPPASGAGMLPQSSPPRVTSGFRLNANAVPFHAPNSPPGAPAPPANSPESMSPQRAPDMLCTAPAPPPKAMHPSLVFGAD